MKPGVSGRMSPGKKQSNNNSSSFDSVVNGDKNLKKRFRSLYYNSSYKYRTYYQKLHALMSQKIDHLKNLLYSNHVTSPNNYSLGPVTRFELNNLQRELNQIHTLYTACDQLLYTEVLVNDKTHSFCIDTGAAASILGKEFLYLLKTSNVKPCPSVLKTASNTPVKVFGKITLMVKIDDHSYLHDFILTSLPKNFLGIDFLKQNSMSINSATGMLTALTNSQDMVQQDATSVALEVDNLVQDTDITLQRKSFSMAESSMNSIIPINASDHLDPICYAIPTVQSIQPPEFSESTDSDLFIPIHHFALDQPISQSDCSQKSILYNQDIVLPTKELSLPSDAECVCPELKESTMSNFILKYPAVFSGKLNSIPKHDIELKIELNSEFRQPYVYQVPYAYRKAVKERIDEMLESGIIRPSSSEFANPITCAMKKDGSVRVCGDFRALNSVTRTDRFSLPRIDYIKRHIRGQVFSTLDLKDGFFQIPVEENSIPKTAIQTDWGLFEYVRMPFGLKNAPPTFQRLVNTVFHGLDNFMFVYIDDVIVFSESIQAHIQHLDLVLERMARYGLVTQARKCSFFVNKIQYLGLEFDTQGYRPLPRLLPKIEEYPEPKDRKQIQKFLGLINYYRTHVPHLAEIAAPLYALLKKTTKFLWTEEHQDAFQQLKKILALRLTLVPLRPEGDLVLQTDASTIACGAVLLQDNKPIEYFSRKLNEAEQRYSTFEREALAMISAIKHFRPILQGRKFQVQTDHKPLLKWKSRPPESERQARMIVKIQDLDFDIVHLSGEHNNLADLLSRPPGQTVSSFQSLYNSLKLNALHLTVLTDELLNAQTEEFIKNTKLPPEQLRVIEGFTYTTHKGKPLLLIPPAFQEDVIQLTHSVGHFGRKRTLRAVCQNYWWPTVAKDCHNFVKYCTACQRFKPTPKVKRDPIHFPETNRFRTVHIDLVGPFKRTFRGNTSLLTVMDRCSRWFEAYPMQSTTTLSCAKRFINDWVSRFGLPDRIISDQGPQFESLLFDILCQRLGIKHHRTTPWHPETNGMLERAHGTLKNSLRCLCRTTQDWDEVLPMALLAMRMAINDTGVSPSLVVFGEQLALPRPVLDETMAIYDDNMPHFVNQLFANWRMIKEKLLHVPETNNNNDEPIFPTEYAFMREPQLKASLEPKWLGPYRVVDTRYPVIRLEIDGKEKNLNWDMIKPAFILQPQETDQSDSESAVDNEILPNISDIHSESVRLNPASQYADLYQELQSQPMPVVAVDPLAEY